MSIRAEDSRSHRQAHNLLSASLYSHWLVRAPSRLFATLWTVAHQAPLHEIFQARILEWVAISYSRESSQARDWTHVSGIGRKIRYHSATWKAQINYTSIKNKIK